MFSNKDQSGYVQQTTGYVKQSNTLVDMEIILYSADDNISPPLIIRYYNQSMVVLHSFEIIGQATQEADGVEKAVWSVLPQSKCTWWYHASHHLCSSIKCRPTGKNL